jgi:hypothetical protein
LVFSGKIGKESVWDCYIIRRKKLKNVRNKRCEWLRDSCSSVGRLQFKLHYIRAGPFPTRSAILSFSSIRNFFHNERGRICINKWAITRRAGIDNQSHNFLNSFTSYCLMRFFYITIFLFITVCRTYHQVKLNQYF